MNNLLSMAVLIATALTVFGIALADHLNLSISNVNATNVTTDSATITWQTDSAANSSVEYGTSSGQYPNRISIDEQTLVHAIILANLTPDTKYYYQVQSSAGSQTSSSQEYTFQTRKEDAVNPVISNLEATNITDTEVIIRWQTDEPATGEVKYGRAADQLNNLYLNASLKNEHNFKITGLQPETTYYYQVTSVDASANISNSETKSVKTQPTPDKEAPEISQIAITDITADSARISWETNELATSKVSYGTSASYTSSAESKSLVTRHSILLENLEADTSYNFKISSQDQAGNLAESDNQTFKTLQMPDTKAPEIQGVAVKSITDSSAQINWNTNEKSTSQVHYGTTASYGLIKSSDELVTDHSLTLTNLSASTTYHFMVKSTDAAGNTGTSNDMTFETAPAEEDEDVRVDFTLNGALESSNSSQITVDVSHASKSAQNIIGETVAINITSATVITQDGQPVSGNELMPGSQINVNGYSQGSAYYANRIEAHQQKFTLTGTIQQINTLQNELVIKVKTATPPLKSYLGQNLTLKTDSQTTIRMNRLYVNLDDIITGKNAQISGHMSGSQAVADKIVILYR